MKQEAAVDYLGDGDDPGTHPYGGAIARALFDRPSAPAAAPERFSPLKDAIQERYGHTTKDDGTMA